MNHAQRYNNVLRNLYLEKSLRETQRQLRTSDGGKINFAHALGPYSVRLDRVFATANKLDRPHEVKTEIFHVVGTNGKGTVSLKIANALTRAGKKVGLYTSPHVGSIRERIKVNGSMISKADFIKWGELLLPHPLTFFEYLTLMSFLHFREERVDAMVIEAGLGALNDATNVLKHTSTVVLTSVDFDHTKQLGSTLKQIAYQKTRAIKPATERVILGPHVPEFVDEMVTSLFEELKEDGPCAAFRSTKYVKRLYPMFGGDNEELNSNVAKAALEHLSLSSFVKEDRMLGRFR